MLWISSMMTTVFPTPAPPNKPVFPPLEYGSNKSTTLMPVSNISTKVLLHLADQFLVDPLDALPGDLHCIEDLGKFSTRKVHVNDRTDHLYNLALVHQSPVCRYGMSARIGAQTPATLANAALI